MSSREGAPSEHRRQLERGEPDPALPQLKIHCKVCDKVASIVQIDDGQFLSYWDGYRWYAIAAVCKTHGRLALDVSKTIRQFYSAGRRSDGVSHCQVPPVSEGEH